AVGLESPRADELSFLTQNTAGYLAFAVPPLWSGALWLAGRVTPAAALAAAGTDILLFAHPSVVNGVGMESARLLVQRPRPFVIENPGAHGGSQGNYTSFYSGHTSFAAAAGTSMVIALASRGAPFFLLVGTGAAAFVLTFLT